MTATPRPDEELIPLDGRSVPKELEELEVSEVEELVAAELDDDADVPGIVAALTAPKIPTPATAAMDALTVRRWIRLSAWSRAHALAWVVRVVSMVERVGDRTKSHLRTGLEVAERWFEARGYTLLRCLPP